MLARLTKILTLVFLASCGQPAFQAPEAAEEIAWVEELLDLDSSHVKVTLEESMILTPSKVGNIIIGECINGDIRLLRSWWEKASSHYKRMLVLHEIGHCLQGLDHDNAILDGCPISYMYPTITALTPECIDRMF